MSKVFKSQWEVGELFPVSAARQIFTVSELTASIRQLLAGRFNQVWVTGEITNLRAQSSGHVYFSIKDDGAQLCCVLFRGEARHIPRELLEDGKKVVAQGDITVYEARGQYQLRITGIELQGLGALQAAFERLKQKLNAEGLFAAERKRPLPRFPRHIGVVTSASGAAIRDVLHVVRRRNPGLRLTLVNCRVQGQGAAVEIAAGVSWLNDWSRRLPRAGDRLDAILVTRGGGSLEDLWAFNEEIVARAIFESALPVVSAVGHEIDFTISDFVADVRAATPSAAAEILTEGVQASRAFLREAGARLAQLVRLDLAAAAEELDRARERLQRRHPRHWIEEQSQIVDSLHADLLRRARSGWRRFFAAFDSWQRRLARLRPALVLEKRRERLRSAQLALADRARLRLKDCRSRLGLAQDRLRLLSPLHVLERGYSITLDAATGQVVRSAEQTKPGQLLRTRLGSGAVDSRVERPLPESQAKPE